MKHTENQIQQLETAILERLHKVNLKPGQCIPSLRRISKMTNSSMYLTRMAFQRLASKGFIIPHWGRGYTMSSSVAGIQHQVGLFCNDHDVSLNLKEGGKLTRIGHLEMAIRQELAQGKNRFTLLASPREGETWSEWIHSAKRSGISALLAFELQSAQAQSAIFDAGIPSVLIQSPCHHTGLHRVFFREYEAGAVLGRMAALYGHRRIGIVIPRSFIPDGPVSSPTLKLIPSTFSAKDLGFIERLQGLQDAFATLSSLQSFSFTLYEWESAPDCIIKDFHQRDNPPTIILNTHRTKTLVRQLISSGIKVPEDVSWLGFSWFTAFDPIVPFEEPKKPNSFKTSTSSKSSCPCSAIGYSIHQLGLHAMKVLNSIPSLRQTKMTQHCIPIQFLDAGTLRQNNRTKGR